MDGIPHRSWLAGRRFPAPEAVEVYGLADGMIGGPTRGPESGTPA
jgi:hypothetical protein